MSVCTLRLVDVHVQHTKSLAEQLAECIGERRCTWRVTGPEFAVQEVCSLDFMTLFAMLSAYETLVAAVHHVCHA